MISHANPILYMVNAFRYGILGISDVSVGWAFVLMLVFIVALAIVALQLLKRGVGLSVVKRREPRASEERRDQPDASPDVPAPCSLSEADRG